MKIEGFEIRKGDYGVEWEMTCYDEATGNVIDLTGYTVTLKIFHFDRKTEVTDWGGSCMIKDAVNGVVSYTIKTTDFDKEGKYWGILECTKTGVRLSCIPFPITVVEI